MVTAPSPFVCLINSKNNTQGRQAVGIWKKRSRMSIAIADGCGYAIALNEIVGKSDRINIYFNFSTKPQNTKHSITFDFVFIGYTKNTPRGIRIPVTSVKGRCPRPLDDGGINCQTFINITNFRADVNTLWRKNSLLMQQCLAQKIFRRAEILCA
jgi:hypothetical protein